MMKKITTEEYRSISFVLTLLWILELLSEDEYDEIMTRVTEHLIAERMRLAKKDGV